MRIASLQPSVTATLVSLGASEHLVACTKYCLDICPDLSDSDIAVVQDSWTAQASQILSAKPDLVVAAVPYQQKAVEEILKAGIRFLGLAPRSLADIYTDTRIIASIVSRQNAAEEMISNFESELNSVRACVSNLPPQTVFSEEWGKPIIHSQRWVAELIEVCGGVFVGNPGKQTDAASVADSNPQVVLAAWCGAGDRVPLEKLVRERSWASTHAAKSGRVFCVSDEFFNTPALPTLAMGLRAIAFAIHPTLFEKPDGIRALQLSH